MTKAKKPEEEEELGLTAIRIRIRKLEKIQHRDYQNLSPEQLQALMILRLDENNLLLRQSMGEDVAAELQKLRNATSISEGELERLYELEKEEMEKEAEKDRKLKEKMKKGINLLIKE